MADIPWGSITGSVLGGAIGSFGGPGMMALGAGVGGGIGGSFDNPGGGDARPGIDYYDRPEYKKLRSLLWEKTNKGFPEWKGQWQQQYDDELLPQIQELYQAKRGLGAGSTPEVAQLGKSGRGLMTDLSRQDLMGRLQALQMLSQTTPQPFATMTPAAPSAMQNLMSFGAPIASSYMQNQSNAQLMKSLLNPESSPLSQVSPNDDYLSNFLSQASAPTGASNYGMDLTGGY